MAELLLTEAANRVYNANPEIINAAIDRFFNRDFYDDTNEIMEERAAAFAKNFDSPQRENTAFGIYQINIVQCCYVVFDLNFCKSFGYGQTIADAALIIALSDDIDLLADDPIQKIIDDITTLEVWHRHNAE